MTRALQERDEARKQWEKAQKDEEHKRITQEEEDKKEEEKDEEDEYAKERSSKRRRVSEQKTSNKTRRKARTDEDMDSSSEADVNQVGTCSTPTKKKRGTRGKMQLHRSNLPIISSQTQRHNRNAKRGKTRSVGEEDSEDGLDDDDDEQKGGKSTRRKVTQRDDAGVYSQNDRDDDEEEEQAQQERIPVKRRGRQAATGGRVRKVGCRSLLSLNSRLTISM